MKGNLRALIVCTGAPFATKVLYALAAMRATVDVLSVGRTNAVRYSRYRRNYLERGWPRSRAERKELAGGINRYAAAHEIEVLIPTDMAVSGLIENISDQLRGIAIFPVSGSRLISGLNNKWQFWRFLRQANIPAPMSRLIADSDRLSDALAGMTYPLIVKPLACEAGHGVVEVKEFAGMVEHLAKPSPYNGLPLIAQEKVGDHDIDVSLLAVGGELIVALVQSHAAPGVLEFVRNEYAVDIARRIVKLTKYTGVANIDMRVDSSTGGISVLECNPRFWFTLQASVWHGVNFVEWGVAWATGRPLPQDLSGKPGRYYLHSDLLKQGIWRPTTWKELSRENVLGLLQALSDPLPHLKRQQVSRLQRRAA